MNAIEVISEGGHAVVASEFLRMNCSVCTEETSMTGTRDAFASLLAHMGWKLGAKPLCRRCYAKRARKAMAEIRRDGY